MKTQTGNSAFYQGPYVFLASRLISIRGGDITPISLSDQGSEPDLVQMAQFP